MSLKIWLPLIKSTNNQGISSLNTFSYNTLTQQADGKLGKCYSGQGIYHIGEELIQNTWSLCAWVKSSSWSQYNDIILCKNTSTSDNCQFYFSIINGASLNIGINNGGGDASCAYTFATNTWYHVAATYDGTKYALYVNGTQIKSGTITNTLKTGMNNIGINCRSTNANGTNQTGDGGKKLNDVRIYDHCLSAAEVKEIAQGLVLHYKLDMQYFKSGINLVTGVTKGGQTTKLTDGRLGVVTSGVNADTYFTINLSESITNGTTYHFSCDASGISEGQYWNFPLGAYNNTSLPCKIYNGHNEFIFTANDINWGTNRLFMDDLNRPDWEHPATFYNFILTKNATYEVKDSSGYGHNGTINGTMSTSSNTARYNSSIIFNGSDNAIKIPFNDIIKTDDYTVSVWTYKETIGTKNYQTILGGPSGFELEARSSSSTSPLYRIHNWGGGTTAYEFNKWNLFTFVRTANDSKLYVNGELKITGTAGTIPSGNYFIGAWNTATQQNYEGLMSDFRLYCTALSADDILALYHTGAKVDNLQNLHTFEFNENGSNKLTKTGILKNYIVEPFLTLADGSKWQLMLYHYVNGGNNLFTSSNATFCNDFGLYSRLAYINNFTYDSKYEFYVLQDDKQFRWTQTSQPTASSITGLTTVSGYTNPVHGLAKASQSNTYIGYGSWWGACGCWTSYSSGGKTGIPGFGSSDANGICTTYLALYARVNNFNAKIANLSSYANNLIEF